MSVDLQPRRTSRRRSWSWVTASSSGSLRSLSRIAGTGKFFQSECVDRDCKF
uniref:Uncharacterized protein n=1 Tax=Physcomitrium patens TaxID=3218 RepID=A0A7I3ZAL5_PHYPA